MKATPLALMSGLSAPAHYANGIKIAERPAWLMTEMLSRFVQSDFLQTRLDRSPQLFLQKDINQIGQSCLHLFPAPRGFSNSPKHLHVKCPSHGEVSVMAPARTSPLCPACMLASSTFQSNYSMAGVRGPARQRSVSSRSLRHVITPLLTHTTVKHVSSPHHNKDNRGSAPTSIAQRGDNSLLNHSHINARRR
ncbi:hypothetical protein F7725_012472 [Dissostichus mawsoni]|uniref:Uncharacterized protein n=1 Tax=Dissostichus mawsoni TaxID=36200 RepID=A0A7J5YMU6_DISMA|nr:hypothetical protein F7725_012472 [Dissostichus mawsoni]